MTTIDPKGYNGNSLVKRDGVTHNFTQEEIGEYQKCMSDPVYFAKTYAKVINLDKGLVCLLYTSPSPRDGLLSRMPSSA